MTSIGRVDKGLDSDIHSELCPLTILTIPKEQGVVYQEAKRDPKWPAWPSALSSLVRQALCLSTASIPDYIRYTWALLSFYRQEKRRFRSH